MVHIPLGFMDFTLIAKTSRVPRVHLNLKNNNHTFKLNFTNKVNIVLPPSSPSFGPLSRTHDLTLALGSLSIPLPPTPCFFHRRTWTRAPT